MRPRTALFVILLVAAVLRCHGGVAATTADGVVLIDQATAATGLPGCPTTGFPIVICHQGSYRLSGNLTISNDEVNVIQIAADDVTLDLNGFTIAGPVTCPDQRPTGGGGCSSYGNGGNGIYSLDHDNITIRNGIVRGMGGAGVNIDSTVWTRKRSALIERLQVFDNGGNGIVLTTGIVTNCNVYQNGFSGIRVSPSGIYNASISFNYLSNNGEYGVWGGGLVSHNTINFNGSSGICCSVTMIYNTILDNSGYGIDSDSGAIGGNGMAENTSGSVRGYHASMHNNICNGALC
jgi:parallel beta helix pectate lyase-like protein